MPFHLFIGTVADNMRDMRIKGRQGRAKLTEQNVRTIRALLRDGLTISAIARQVKISRQQVRRIRDGKNWDHVV